MNTVTRRLLSFAALSLMLFCGPAQSSSAEQAVSILDDRQISTDASGVPHAEQVMALNPRDSRNMLAASFAVEGSRMVTVVYYTKDGGKTWKRALFPKAAPTHFLDSIDPELTAGADGSAYFVTEKEGFGFWVDRTRDGGQTWDKPNYQHHIFDYDRSWATVAKGEFAGRLVISGFGATFEPGHVKLKHCGGATTSTSDDGGVTFTEPRVMMAREHGCLVSAEQMVSRDDGAIFTFINAFPRGGSPGGSFYVSPSFDGGFLLEEPRKVTDYHDAPSSSTYSPVELGTAIDSSRGRYRNRMYGVWSDFDGRSFVIKSVHTTTDWMHWSKPIVLNDDTGKVNHALPRVAVNRDGTVAVIWMDKRNAPSDMCYRLATAVSFDGGEHFSRNFVRSGTTCSSDKRNAAYALYPGFFSPDGKLQMMIMSSLNGKWSIGGDTNGLTANPDGTFNVVWSNARAGVQQLWYTRFRANHVPGISVASNGSGRVASAAVARRSPPAPVALSAPITANIDLHFALDIQSASYDPKTKMFSATLALKNALPASIRGPFVLTQATVASFERGGIQTEGADNNVAGKGARWSFRSARNDGVLHQGESTLPRLLRWKISGDSAFSFDVTKTNR